MGAEIKEITWHLNADMTVVELVDGNRIGLEGLLNRDEVERYLSFYD